MCQFLILHLLSMDQALGLRLPDVTEPCGKVIVSWDKNIFCQCSLLDPMRSLKTDKSF